MLDIKFIKENPDLIKDAATKKHISFDLDALLDVDKKRLEVLSLVESLRAEQNVVSDNVTKVGADERAHMIEEMKKLKEHLKEKERELGALGVLAFRVLWGRGGRSTKTRRAAPR